jgi:hypothetical protein
MAKTKQQKKHYNRMRASGIRKKVARQLTDLSTQVRGKKQAKKPLRDAVSQLEATVTELRTHIGHSDRKAAGRKAARTRRAKTQKRAASARKGARARS